MTRNQAARKRAEDAPVALIEYAAGEGSAELTARLHTWPTPGIVPGEVAALLREDGREVTAEEAAAATQWEAMRAAEQEELRAAADRDRAHAEANQTPAWRATLVSDHLWQWRSRDSLRRLGLKGTDEEIAMSFIDIATTLPDSSTSTTGLSLLTTVIETIPRQITDRHLLVTTVPERTSRIPLAVARTPGVVAVVGNAVIEAVAVDGEPLVTAQPGVLSRQRYRVAPVAQGELFGGPKTLDRHAVGGALLGAVATAPLSGDGRSPIRADVTRLGNIAFALTGPVKLSDSEGAILVGGADTPANRRRFNAAMWVLRTLFIEVIPGMPWALADAEPGPVNRLGIARWMRDRTAAYHLTGALFRPATKWGSLERTIAGIEGALAWGPTAGKGKGARIPDRLRPVRRGGPGDEVFIPWWQVLRLAGEPVAPDAPRRADLNRWDARANLIEAAGYFLPDGVNPLQAQAQVGDTIEAVRRIGGRGRGAEAGLIVRASARWCAAHERGAIRTRWPATRLFNSPDRRKYP